MVLMTLDASLLTEDQQFQQDYITKLKDANKTLFNNYFDRIFFVIVCDKDLSQDFRRRENIMQSIWNVFSNFRRNDNQTIFVQKESSDSLLLDRGDFAIVENTIFHAVRCAMSVALKKAVAQFYSSVRDFQAAIPGESLLNQLFEMMSQISDPSVVSLFSLNLVEHQKGYVKQDAKLVLQQCLEQYCKYLELKKAKITESQAEYRMSQVSKYLAGDSIVDVNRLAQRIKATKDAIAEEKRKIKKK